MLGDGDGWARCSRAHRHWGRHGAAGLLLCHTDDSGDLHVLLQHRAWWSHYGDTWGVPGGARGRNESPEQAAVREVGEEVTVDLSAVRLAGRFVDDHGGWSYTTVLGWSEQLLDVAPFGGESTDARWVPADQLGTLPLHPGFAASWPLLQQSLRRSA